MTERCVAVLGWKDEPTDAVEEYCQFLATALAKRGVELQILRVRWPELGWKEARKELQEKIADLQPTWSLLQYTALGWSRRGFPQGVIGVMRDLKKNGRRCAVVFHDPEPYPGKRIRDRFRKMIQTLVMRRLVGLADLTILTIPWETIRWVPKHSPKVTFIPVGANLPPAQYPENSEKSTGSGIPTIVVFSISTGALGGIEVARIAKAMRLASDELGAVRLSMVGRNSEIRGTELREELKGKQVEVVIHGLLKPEDVVKVLTESDVMLFVRGPISTRRGSALAGIACGLPVVAWDGWETAGPILEAGVVLLPDQRDDAFGPGLVRVLKDRTYRESLSQRSRQAQSRYFSWDAIAAEYAAKLRDE